MIDLHCHILPQLDDGAQSLADSLEMARLAVRSGVTAMAATPHCIDDRSGEIRERILILRELLEEEGIPLRLYMGMEIYGTEDTAQLLREGRLLTLNNSRYPLIEFSFRGSGELQTEILQSVLRAGYQPVVAHPERYLYVQDQPVLLNIWKDMGCLFQINRGSLLGRFGESAQEMAVSMVERGFASVVASDGHSPRVRTPWMQDVFRLLEEQVAPAAAQYLLIHNPKAILNNQPIPTAEPDWF